jgi:carboxymethylenebutenolidase
MEVIRLNDAFDAYMSGPVGAPAVVVVQEWWGINEMIKAHALKIAEQGYRVLVPDLYKGKLCLDVEEAHHNMDNLDFPGAVAEIVQAAAFLKKEGSAKVGICGFCMGGALTMGGLAKSADIVCGAPFYGVNFGLFECTQLAQKPVQGHFGAEDTMAGFSDAATGKKLAAELQAAGNAEAEVFIYERVGHAFMNSESAPFADFAERQAKLGFPPYDASQADLAWSRLFGFFTKHLK